MPGPEQSLHPLTDAIQRRGDGVTPDETINQIIDLAVAVLDACDSASITVVSGDERRTVAASDDVATSLDEAQYAAGDGPCVRAASERTVVRVAGATDDERWPLFAEQAAAVGVAASLSLPLDIDAGAGGALNLYSRTGDFGQNDERLGRLLAAQAGVAVRLARTYQSIAELAGQLEQALESRDVIGQAKGIIAVQEGCTTEEAFGVLRERSQRQNRKLRDVAGDVVEETTGSGRSQQDAG